MVGKTGRLAFMVMAMLTMFGSATSSLTPTVSTTLQPSQSGVNIQKSVSFEDREAKSLLDQPIIMQMLPNDSYFPKNTNTESGESPSLAPKISEPTGESDSNQNTNDYRTQASSYSYSSSSPWTPIPANTLPFAHGQPVYFPAPSVYGYPVNNYRPPSINFEAGSPNSFVSYGPPAALKQVDPIYSVPELINPQPIPEKQPEVLYNVPVKSVEYIAPVKTEYGVPEQKPLPQYNAIQKPYEAEKDEPYYAVPPKYGEPGPTSSSYGAPVVYENTGVKPAYGAPEGHSGVYENPTQTSSYGVPVYGAPHAHVAKNVHNIHQKVLHRYNHHQKVLHEHNLHRYIVHNYHLHRFHVHNHHNQKENIHVHKEHIHNKYEQKETEEHKTKETEGVTHKTVTEVKESHRNAPPIYKMHVVKPQWSPWG